MLDDDGDPGPQPPSGPREDDDEGGDSSPDYELALSTNDVDLTDLDTLNLGDREEIREEDYFELTYELKKDGEPVQPEEVSLEIDKYGDHKKPEAEYNDGKIILPCTEVYEGSNSFILEAEIDGETVKTEQIGQKTVPDKYIIEGFVDGERITSHRTPYDFDTQKIDREEFKQKRRETVEEISDYTDKPEDMTEVVDKDRIDQILEDPELPEKEKKRHVLHYVSLDLAESIGHFSALAQLQAYNEEKVIEDFTDYEEVYTAGFNNTAPRGVSGTGGGHGSKSAYIDGDWYHNETAIPETLHIEDIEEANMVSGGGSLGNFTSIIGQMGTEDIEGIRLGNKLRRMNTFYSANAITGREVTTTDLAVNNTYAGTGLDMVRDNEEFSKIMDPVWVGADHFLETGRETLLVETPGDPVIISTNDSRFNNRIRKDMKDTGEENLQFPEDEDSPLLNDEEIVETALEGSSDPAN